MEGVKMNRLSLSPWINGLSLRPWKWMDLVLQWIGRGAAWRLKDRQFTAEESTAFAMTGGALVGAVLGALTGFAVFDSSRNINVIDGTIIGALLGICIGSTFGAFVETVDRMISELLKSLDSK